MRIIRDYQSWPADLKGGVVAIGNFDGLHRGHREVLRQAKAKADSLGTHLLVLTFEPHPRHLFQPDAPELRIMSFSQKAGHLRDIGVSAILAQRFTRAFSQLSADEFMQHVLADALAAKCIITGEDFIFGHNRSGHSESLRDFVESNKEFEYLPIAPIGNEGEGKFSSSKIREHLRQGEMRHVADALGQPYSWSRTVIHGEKRGRSIGFPTANILPSALLLPRFGVYAMRCSWAENKAMAVANLGVRPTVGGEQALLEVHLFGVDTDMYGKKLCVEFIEHLRDEQKFTDLDELKDQIAKDCEQAREVLI